MKRKARATDLTFSDLPKRRLYLFGFVFRHRWRLLLALGGLTLLFAIPLLLSFQYRQMVITSQNDKTISLPFLFSSLLMLIGFVCFGIGQSGISLIFLRLSWGQGIIFWGDFREGIKKNWKSFGLHFAVDGMLVLVADFVAITSSNEILAVIPWVILQTFFIPEALLAIAQIPIYSLSEFSYWRNGFLLYLKSVPLTLLAAIMLTIPVLVFLLPFGIINLAFFALVLLLYFPIAELASSLIFQYIFDRHVNKIHYPSIYQKGLRKEPTPDDEW